MSKVVTTAIMLFLCLSTAWAQNRKALKKMYRQRDKYMFVARPLVENFSERLPVTVSFGLHIVPVTIHGKQYSFLFDSGASSAISTELEAALGLKPVMEDVVKDASGLGQASKFYMIDSLVLGNITFGSIGVVSMPFSALSKALCIPLDGIIGANLMRSCFWKTDYNSNELLFSDHAFVPGPGSLSLPFEENFSGCPEVMMKLGATSFSATWDSGYNGDICIGDSLYFKNAQSKGAPLASGKGLLPQTLLGQLESNIYYAAPDSMWLSGNLLQNEPLDISAMPSRLIGTKFMARYKTVIVDWKAHTIMLEKKPEPAGNKEGLSFGFTPGLVNGRLQVVMIWDHSAAYARGIRVGDLITEINGIPSTQLSESDWCTIKKEMVTWNEEIPVTFLKEEKPLTFTFKKEPILKP